MVIIFLSIKKIIVKHSRKKLRIDEQKDFTPEALVDTSFLLEALAEPQ